MEIMRLFQRSFCISKSASHVYSMNRYMFFFEQLSVNPRFDSNITIFAVAIRLVQNF